MDIERNSTLGSGILREGVELLGGIIGIWLGVVIGVIGQLKATVVVESNPRLGTMSFGDALFIQHGIDWLFFHEPLTTTAGSAMLLGVFLGASWKKIF